jgi:flagellar assembly protein FliH
MTLVFSRNFDDEANWKSGENCSCDKYSQEQVDALIETAKASAFQTGLKEGYSAALAKFTEEADHIQNEAVEEIRSQLRILFEKANSYNAVLETQILDFSLSICEQVFPYLQHTQSHERALTQIKKTMRLALNSPYIHITLSNDALPRLTPFIENLADELGIKDQIKLSSDDNLENGATLVEWKNGFMDYSFDVVCERILTALKSAQSTIPTPLINGSDDRA